MYIIPAHYENFLKGVDKYSQCKYQEAIKWFQKDNQVLNNQQSTVNNKNLHLASSIQTLINLSSCYIRTGQYQKAMNYSFQALRLNPYISLTYYNMTSILIREQKYTQAIQKIRCALSCEYLRIYEESYNKQYLDKAIQNATNNIKAIQYRVVLNKQYIEIIGIIDEKLQNDSSNVNKTLINTKQQIQNDLKVLKKLKNVYEVRFNNKNVSDLENNQKQYQKRNNKVSKQNYHIKTLSSPFILQGASAINQFGQKNDKQTCQKNKIIQQIKYLQRLRQQYLSLLEVEICYNSSETASNALKKSSQLKQCLQGHLQKLFMNKGDKAIQLCKNRQKQSNLKIKNQSKAQQKSINLENRCIKPNQKFHTRALLYIDKQNRTSNISSINNKKLNQTNKTQNKHKIKKLNKKNNSITSYSKIMSNINKSKIQVQQKITNKQNKIIRNKPELNDYSNQRQQQLIKQTKSKLMINNPKQVLNQLKANQEQWYCSQKMIQSQIIQKDHTMQSSLQSLQNGNTQYDENQDFTQVKQQSTDYLQQVNILNSSIISILDYEDDHQYYQRHNRSIIIETKQVKMISSILPQKTNNQNCQQIKSIKYNRKPNNNIRYSKKQNQSTTYSRNLLTRTDIHKSCQNLFNNNDNTQFINLVKQSKALIQSKSYHKLLSCSKCSIDVEQQKKKHQNTKIQINLTEIYNYSGGDYSQLRPYCVIKYKGQEEITSTGRGKFPNWNQPLFINIQENDKYENDNYKSQNIQIQIWSKPCCRKIYIQDKNSINQSRSINSQSQYLGKGIIKLTNKNWGTYKVLLEKSYSDKQDFTNNEFELNKSKLIKIGYMHIVLEKTSLQYQN